MDKWLHPLYGGEGNYISILKLQRCRVEVWGQIISLFPHFIGHVIIHTCLDWRYFVLVKNAEATNPQALFNQKFISFKNVLIVTRKVTKFGLCWFYCFSWCIAYYPINQGYKCIVHQPFHYSDVIWPPLRLKTPVIRNAYSYIMITFSNAFADGTSFVFWMKKIREVCSTELNWWLATIVYSQ